MAMKKFLKIAPALIFLAPTLAFAAYNNVTMDSNVVLNIGGIQVNVTGVTSQSITVTGATFSVDLQPGSTITVTAPSRNQLNPVTQSSSGVTVACDNSSSSVTITPGTAETVTFSPSTTLCSDSSSSGGGSGGGGNGPIISLGSGSGGGSVISASPAAATPAAGTASSGDAHAAFVAQLQTQLQALLAQIAALGGNVPASVNASFTRNLTVGSTGSDVKALQIWLNAHGFIVAKSGSGSSGNETTKFGNATKAALAKWQASVGISPASGYFGVKTRSYLAAHP